MLEYFLLAQEKASAGGSLTQMLTMIALAIAFFYFIVLRPERKRRKALDLRRNSMKKGDKVTAMGILATIDKVNDATVILKLVGDAKMEVLKAAISEVHVAEQQGIEPVVEKA
ncbi:MAG: preprotein translocase subunit YajC [Verrucomicrobia bacterium]|nr:preprotein translocase subunit YajC [Verrucomicrobiota bacterium]